MTAQTIYDMLYNHYGNPGWWPAKSPYEVIVGAILTQNTAWGNVEKAIANFGDNLIPQTVLDMDLQALMDIINPAGFFKQKAVYLKEITMWFAKYGFDVSAVQARQLSELRPELLAVKGVGKETADSILLYAFGFATFVVDAYTMRMCARLPLAAGKTYDAVKAYFEANLLRCAELYNNYHALIVINGKEFCRKTRPLCGKCPLAMICKKML